jgi:transposase-like protein
MAKYYAKYHDVVFLDATYNTNKANLALAIFSGISSEGKNIILGIALLSRETVDHY